MSRETFLDQNQPEILIPQYEGRVVHFENVTIHPDKTFWTFSPEGEERRIPVYSIWNYNHHQEIVDKIAQGNVALLYMWGTYGVGKLLNSPEWQKGGKQEESQKVRSIKKGRPWSDKFISLVYPDDEIDFWDTDRFHPCVKHLQWPQKRWSLYDIGPVHIIAYVKPRNPHLDLSLIRSAEGTAPFYYMPNPAFNHIVELLRKDVKHAVFGGGSANYHEETPAFTTKDVYQMIAEKKRWQQNVDLIIVDEIAEAAKVFISQTMVRVPQLGSDDAWHKVREGGLLAERWANLVGYNLKDAPEGVKYASRLLPYTAENNHYIDQRISLSRDQMKRFHNQKFYRTFN